MAATVCCLFDEDEVCKKISDDKFVFGLVIESSEYTNSDDDDEDEDILKRGTVRVAWHPDGKETVTPENKLILTDRSLMPGDVVRRLIKGKNSQLGFVQDMNIKCHLHIKGTNKYIYDVDSRDLCDNNINNLSTKTFNSNPSDVTLDSWVGRIEEIHEEVTLLFPDGARCKVKEAEDLESFDPVDEQSDADDYTFSASGLYYRGKLLRGCVADLNGIEWILSTNKHGPKTSKKSQNVADIVRVEETKVWAVDVYWMCHGLTKVDNPAAKSVPPPSTVEQPYLQRLKVLDWFGHCSVQIGDKANYVIKDTDVLENNSPKGTYIPDAVHRNCEPSSNDNCTHKTETSDSQANEPIFTSENKENEGFVHAENVVDKNDGVNEDVKDDDNDDDYEDVESTDSESEVNHNVSKSHAGRRKGRKGATLKCSKKTQSRKKTKPLKFETEFPTCRPGEKVPVEVCYTCSKACVMWQDGTIEEDVPSYELFPIHDLDEHEFFPGDFVISSKEICVKDQDYGVVVSCDHEQRICCVKWMKTVDMTQGNRPDESVEAEESSVYDIKDHGDFKFRPSQTIVRVGEVKDMSENTSAVGQVWRLDPLGAVFVKWPNGEITRCYPQELYIVSDEMSDAESMSGGEEDSDDDSDVSWETESEEEVDPESEEIRQNDGIKMLIMTKEKKEELDGLLQRALTALQNLEQQFVNFDGLQVPIAYHHFRGIMTIYRKCQDLEKLLKSSYFEEPEIRDLVEEVKKILQEEKRNEINKKIMHVYESRKCQNKTESDKNMQCVESKDGNSEAVDKEDRATSRSSDLETEEDSSSCSATSKRTQPSEIAPTIKGTQPNDIAAAIKGTQPNDIAAAIKGTQPNDVAATIKRTQPNDIAANEEGKPNNSGVNQSREDGSDAIDKTETCDDDLSTEDISVSDIVTNIVNKAIVDAIGGCPCDGQSQSQVENFQPTNENVFLEQNHVDTTGTIDGSKGKHFTADFLSETSDSASNADSGVSMSVSSAENGSQKCELEGKRDEAVALMKKNEFCLKICHQLHIQMMKFQEEMNRRWEYTQQKEKLKDKKEDVPVNSSDTSTRENKALEFDMPQEDCDPVEEVILGIKVENSGSVSDDMKSICNLYKDIVTSDFQGFQLCEEVPIQHRLSANEYCPSDAKSFISSVRKELKLLQSSLPSGIFVKGFEDRMDLFSVMIIGPAKTPYEDALFFFDVQLPGDYPASPPLFQYISYCQDRLNPNLYEDGKVCVSLLGTWAGKGNETWTKQSNLLQVLVSIQGLILVAEPYYNEAGYERQRGTQQGRENSKMYNEMAVLKLVQNMTGMIRNPPHSFIQEMTSHLRIHGPRMIERIEGWVQMSQTTGNQEHNSTTQNLQNSLETNSQSVINSDVLGAECCKQSGECKQSLQTVISQEKDMEPEFSLIPASRGFCLTMKKHLEEFRKTLQTMMSE